MVATVQAKAFEENVRAVRDDFASTEFRVATYRVVPDVWRSARLVERIPTISALVELQPCRRREEKGLVQPVAEIDDTDASVPEGAESTFVHLAVSCSNKSRVTQ